MARLHSCWHWGWVLAFLLAAGALQAVHGQGIYIKRFVPGNYLGDNRHRVVLGNKAQQTYNLSGFLLVTRDYSVQLPAGTRVPPGGELVLGKQQAGHVRRLDIALSKTPNFLIRLYSKKVDGNYVVLFNRQQRIVDAMYHSQLPNVPFLPARDTLILQNNRIVPYALPPESSPAWGYYPFGTDPAVGFEQNEQGEWQVIPANPQTQLYPRITFEDLKARYEDGVVTLKWQTRASDELRYIIIERGKDQRSYERVGRVKARKATAGEQMTEYTFYDTDLQQDSTYYYRLRSVDRGGQAAYSKVVEVTIQELPVEFWLKLYPEAARSAKEVSIRFYSAYSQQVKIKLLDRHFREVGILFNNLVYAETQHLLKLTKHLAAGRYLIAAYTEERRYFKTLEVK